MADAIVRPGSFKNLTMKAMHLRAVALASSTILENGVDERGPIIIPARARRRYFRILVDICTEVLYHLSCGLTNYLYDTKPQEENDIGPLDNCSPLFFVINSDFYLVIGSSKYRWVWSHHVSSFYCQHCHVDHHLVSKAKKICGDCFLGGSRLVYTNLSWIRFLRRRTFPCIR